MDPDAREKFLASLRKVGGRKQIPALIYVTHHIEEILPSFRKTLVLRAGKVLYAGQTGRVLQHDLLEDLYGIALTVVKRKGRYWPVVR